MIEALIFLVMLTVLVLIHEAGHFFMAKKFGVKVEEFGFGLPPRAFGIKKGETVYSVNWLPIGGFVKLYGEDDAGGGKLDVRPKKLSVTHESRAFYAKPVWQRAIIVVAGVVMNFILAVAITSYIYTQGVTVPTNEVKIESIEQDSPAATAGLQNGDIILSIDGKQITKISELQKEVRPKIEEDVRLVVKRGGEVKEFAMNTKKETSEGQTYGRIGVALNDAQLKKYAWYEAPIVGTKDLLILSWLTVAGLGTMLWQWIFGGIVPEGVAGPIGVYAITKEAAKISATAVISIGAFLSLNLAILNILPIPALDGGRLFFILIEGVTGRKVNPHFERYAHTIAMIIIYALIGLITFRDITRLILGQPFLPTP